MRIRTLTLVWLLLLSAHGHCLADEIIFHNGDRLTGMFEQMQEKTVVFTADMVGEMKIPLARIARITAAQPLAVHLYDGVIVETAQLQQDNATWTFIPRGATAPAQIKPAMLSAINPPPVPPVAVSGNITAGMTDSHGHSSSTQANMDFSLTVRTRKHRFKVSGLYLIGREDNPDRHLPGESDTITTDENFTMDAKYDYFFWDGFYWYLGCRYKRDITSDLQYRLIPGSGLGYQWVETDTLKLSTDTGLSWYKEKYRSHVANPAYVPGGSEPERLRVVDRKDDAAWQAGLRFEWQPHEKVQILSNATYTENFNDREDYFFAGDVELRAYFTKKFYSSIKAILDYDNTPGDDVNSTESKYIFGLGWGF